MDSTQPGWRWCHKCQGMFFVGHTSQGTCPADGTAHDASQSGAYSAIKGETSSGQQGGWKWCNKCQGMFFSGNVSQGTCPADGLAHDDSQSGDYAAIMGETAFRQQGGWRWCHKCQGMFFSGNPSQGTCPADKKAHDASKSGHYAMTEDWLALQVTVVTGDDDLRSGSWADLMMKIKGVPTPLEADQFTGTGGLSDNTAVTLPVVFAVPDTFILSDIEYFQILHVSQENGLQTPDNWNMNSVQIYSGASLIRQGGYHRFDGQNPLFTF